MNGIAVYWREADSRSLSRQTLQFVTARNVHTQPIPLTTAQFTIQQFNDSTIPVLNPPPKPHFKTVTGLVTGRLPAVDSWELLRTRNLRKLKGFESYFFIHAVLMIHENAKRSNFTNRTVNFFWPFVHFPLLSPHVLIIAAEL
jgi:hypothetical protein